MKHNLATPQFILTMFLLWAFLAFLALIFGWLLPYVISCPPGSIDVMTTAVACLGVGGVTQAFILLLTLSWQFYHRKRPEEKPEEKIGK